MPIPRPSKNESEKEFIARCMGNVVMVEDYPDNDQRLPVCNTSWKELNKDFKKHKDGNTVTQELFAVGKWNGYSFTKEDLVAMANSFSALREYLKVPLKFGHNGKQKMTDGFPAIGWVEDVWVDKDSKGRDKLFGKFAEVPDIVFNAIKKKLYRQVSIELDFGVEHKGRHYSYVLTGVALLGADIPAVSTLNDLTHYMGRDSLVASEHVAFTLNTVNGIIQKEDNMPTVEELQAKLDKEKAERQADKETFARKEDEQGRKIATLEKSDKDRVAAERTDKVKYNREQITSVLNTAVEKMELTPAQRDSFTKLLKVEDDDAMFAADIDEVKKLVESSKVDGKKFNKDSGKDNKDDDFDGDAGDELHHKALEIQSKNDKMPYSRALTKAFELNPKLARAHIDATTEGGA